MQLIGGRGWGLGDQTPPHQKKSEEQQEGGSGEVEAGARDYDPQSMFVPPRMCPLSPEAKHDWAWLALGWKV